jgi:ribosomal protein S18 acetylase RimI-like enzyme
MSRYTSRPYTDTADLPAVIALVRTCRALENGDPWPPAHTIRRYLSSVAPGAAPQARLWEDRSGRLLAFAAIWDEEVLVFCVHPCAPRADLLPAILTWGCRCAQRTGEQATLCVLLRTDDRGISAVLEREGFRPEPWSTLQMRRPLITPIPIPQVPDGYTLRPLADEPEITAVTALHQEVFGTSAGVGAERLAMMHDPEYLPELDLVVGAPDGTLAAFGLGAISYEEDWCRGGRAGWIELIGTRAAYRRCGLGRALLLTLLQRLKGYGMDAALLGTGSWNTAAQRLFATLGFHIVYELRWYVWQAAARTRAWPAARVA